MDRERMKELLYQNVDPLDIAIMKWEEGEDLDSSWNCALCHLFLSKECVGCLIYEHTGQTSCKGTPYVEYALHVTECDQCGSGHCDEAEQLRLEELKFLRDLRASHNSQGHNQA